VPAPARRQHGSARSDDDAASRAIVQEILTALLFGATPRYMHWMEQGKQKLELRI
jgi:hypothetical protein